MRAKIVIVNFIFENILVLNLRGFGVLGFKTAEYTGTDVSRMSKEKREAGSVCMSPSGLSQAHIDTRGGSATCGLPATGRTDSGAPTCGGRNCGTKVKPLGTIKGAGSRSSKISSIFPIDVIENFFEV